MKNLFLREETGLELSEYAVAAAIIVVTAVFAFRALGLAIQGVFITMTTVING
ncbi:MAG: Flp family type IVb pilin [Pyrinomonadaceae bacterium]